MPDVTPHEVSLAVWDVESPLIVTHASKMKIGARCSQGCALTGQAIIVRDTALKTASIGELGSQPWPGTDALYWAEVGFIAPSQEGRFQWEVTLTASGLELPHTIASTQFSFITIPSPEHRVTLKVVEKNTEAAIEEAHVRLGMYRGRTNEAGFASVELPKGSYEVGVYKLGYQAPSRTVEVTGDVTIRIEIELEPEPANEYWA
jgi:hypothetical protein